MGRPVGASNISMLTSYEGGHDFHFCVTPPDSSRDHFDLKDCVKEHRVYDNLKVFRATGGAKKATKFHDDAPTEAPKRLPKPEKSKVPATPTKSRNPNGRPVSGSALSVKLYRPAQGDIVNAPSLSTLRSRFGRQIGTSAMKGFREKGFHVYPDGAVVWSADRETPFAVRQRMDGKGLLARANELKAKEA